MHSQILQCDAQRRYRRWRSWNGRGICGRVCRNGEISCLSAFDTAVEGLSDHVFFNVCRYMRLTSSLQP